MTDSEILKNYAFKPMYVIAVINYQGSRKERYLFVTKSNSDDGKNWLSRVYRRRRATV